MFATLYGLSWEERTLVYVVSLVLAVKSVRQRQRASADLLRLLGEFKRMVNVCIAVGIEENVSSLKTISSKSYRRLSHDILSYYRLYALSTDTRQLRNHRKHQHKNDCTNVHDAANLNVTA